MRLNVSAAMDLLLAAEAGGIWAQKSGHSTSIVHGTVIGTNDVKGQSDAVRGALVGGTDERGVRPRHAQDRDSLQQLIAACPQ